VSRIIWNLVIFACVLACTPALSAQGDVSVEARVLDDTVYVGVDALLEIVVDGDVSAEEPSFPEVENLEVVPAGRSTQSSEGLSVVNGVPTRVRSVRTAFRYQITAKREGAIRIPAIDVTVGEETYSTQAFWIEATTAQEMEDFKLRIEVDKDQAYVGEPIVGRLVWYIASTNIELGRRISSLEHDAFDFIYPDPRPSGTVQPGDLFDFLVGSERVRAYRGTGKLEERTFITLTIDLVIVAKKPGSYQLGPISLNFQRRLGGFHVKRETIGSNTPTIEVLEPPTAGRPRTFGGLIGPHTIRASADQSEANVGDPIELTISISSDSFVSPSAAPDLSTQDEIDSGFKLSTEGWRETPTGDPSRRVFQTQVRPKSAGIERIPGIELSYFDPERGVYETTSSAAIPLRVRATREVTSSDAIGRIGESIAPSRPLTSRSTGLPANRSAEQVLRRQRPNPLTLAVSPLGAAVFSAPVLIYGATVFLLAHRKRSSRSAARRAGALRAARTSLRRHGPEAAIRSYLGCRFDLVPTAITSRDAHRLTTEFDPEASRVLTGCLQSAEASTYGSSHLATPDPNEVLGALARIDRASKEVVK